MRFNKIKSNSIPVLFIAVYALYAFLVYLSPHYLWFIFHRVLITIGQIVVGLVEFPLRFLLFFATKIPIEYFEEIAYLYFIIAGFGIGRIVQSSWRKGGEARTRVATILLINSLIGLCLPIFSDAIVTTNSAQDCENFISPNNGLRIVYFDEFGWLSGSHHFYLFSSDGDENWEQLMSNRHDDPTDSDCNTIASIGDEVIWVWSGFSVLTSTNNGKTWNEWSWDCCANGRIKHVEFQDSKTGVVQMYHWSNEYSEFFTTDSGKTWQPKKE